MTMRDSFATCPRCDGGLDEKGTRLVCTQCEGVLVPELDVMTLVAEVRTLNVGEAVEPVPLDLETTETTEQALRCPRCLTTMAKRVLYGLTVDRCEAHGIWFDGKELQAALDHAGIARLKTARTLSTERKVVITLTTAAFIALNVIRFIYF